MPALLHHSLALAILTAAAALLLQQDAVHHLDMHQVVRSLADPEGRGHYAHFGFQWFALLLGRLCEGSAITVYQAIRLSCGLGLGLASLFAHRACLATGLGAGAAAAATVASASVPGVLFFATTAEIHGVFLPLATLFWWSVARAHRSTGPSTWCWIGTGAASALAAAMHNSGHLLAGWAVAVAWLSRARGGNPGSRLRPLAPLLGHAVVFGALRATDGLLLGRADEAATVGQLSHALSRWPGPAYTLRVTWEEWLWPLMPLSILFLTGIVRRALRPFVACTLLAALAYIAVDSAILTEFREHGAYALPLALPAAALAAAALPRAAMWTVAAASLALGVWQVRDQDPQRIPDPAMAEGISAARRSHPDDTVMLLDWKEIDSVLVFGPPTWHHVPNDPRFGAFAASPEDPERARRLLHRLVFEAHERGGALMLSDSCRDFFVARLPETAAAILRDYRVQPIAFGPFGAVRVHPAP